MNRTQEEKQRIEDVIQAAYWRRKGTSDYPSFAEAFRFGMELSERGSVFGCNISMGDEQCEWRTPNGREEDHDLKSTVETLNCSQVKGHPGDHTTFYDEHAGRRTSSKTWFIPE